MLPTVDFCGLTVTRLIIGANPFGGFSHQNRERDQDMRTYYTPERIMELKHRYRDRIGGSDAVWQSKMDCKCGFLVWMRDVRPIEPVRIEKKDWRAWVVLTKEKDFGLLTN